ncbi:MAG: holo-ACP synthase [Phycisphaerales bacterium]
MRPAATERPASPGIVGHGIDLVEIERIGRMLESHPERFRDRCFTPAEQAWADAGGRLTMQRFAGRFAAKEAASKALGTGISGDIRWTDFEVLPADGGAPILQLHGGAAARAAERGITNLHISITHSGGLAMASVIASIDPAGPGSQAAVPEA